MGGPIVSSEDCRDDSEGKQPDISPFQEAFSPRGKAGGHQAKDEPVRTSDRHGVVSSCGNRNERVNVVCRDARGNGSLGSDLPI